MLDRDHATRNDLIQIILAQRDTIADQDCRIAALEQEVAEGRQVLRHLTTQLGAGQATDDAAPAPGTPHGMPGHTPTQAESRAERPRRKRAKGYGRHRMAATEQVRHALRACPDCGAPLAGGTVKRTREVIELPLPQIIVTAHV